MGFLFYKEVFLKISDISFGFLLENKAISFKKITSNPFPVGLSNICYTPLNKFL